MKKNIYKLSFKEANIFLDFPIDDKNHLQKAEESYYVIQKILVKSAWIEFVNDRFSWLFIRDLIEFNIRFSSKFNALNIESILNEIKHLEKPTEFLTLTGPCDFYKGDWLNGLKQKHYVQDSLKNLSKNFERVLNSGKKKKALEEDISKLIDQKKSFKDFLGLIGPHFWNPFIDSLDKKLGERKDYLTGEWIIFYEKNDTKYYLALWEHDLDDSLKAKQIHKFCKVEYPEFKILEHLNT